MKKALFLALALPLSFNSYANPYQFEGGLTWGKSETENDIGFKDTNSILDVDLTVHLDPVENHGGPFKHAAFLDKSTFGTLDLGFGDLDDKEILGRIVTKKDHLFELEWTKLNWGSTYRAGFGKYFDKVTDIVVSFEFESNDSGLSEDKKLDIHVNYLSKRKDGKSIFANGGIKIGQTSFPSFTNESDDFGLGFDFKVEYFPTKKFGIGAGFDLYGAGEETETTTTLNTSYHMDNTAFVEFAWNYIQRDYFASSAITDQDTTNNLILRLGVRM